MMTIVTVVTLREGSEPEWDAAMRERLEAAKGQPGWIGGQLIMPVDALNQRGIIGTWDTRAHWESWHNDPAFTETRQRLEGLQVGEAQTHWYEVLTDERP